MPTSALRRIIFALLLCLLTASAFASRPTLDTYPLKVHVFMRRVHHNRKFGAYYGEGKANLIEGEHIVGVEFTYDCLYRFLDSDLDEYYPARWKKPGQELDILMGEIGSDDHTHTCRFQIAPKQFVFLRRHGHLEEVTPQEYATLEDAKHERDQAMRPADLNPADYPIQLALLHMNWTGNTDGIHTGTGQANLKSSTGINAVDFSIHCPVAIQPTPDGRYLLARWVEPGAHLQLLLRSIDVDGAPGATCELLTAVQPDVYLRTGSNVKAISQDEYKRRTGSADPAAN